MSFEMEVINIARPQSNSQRGRRKKSDVSKIVDKVTEKANADLDKAKDDFKATINNIGSDANEQLEQEVLNKTSLEQSPDGVVDKVVETTIENSVEGEPMAVKLEEAVAQEEAIVGDRKVEVDDLSDSADLLARMGNTDDDPAAQIELGSSNIDIQNDIEDGQIKLEKKSDSKVASDSEKDELIKGAADDLTSLVRGNTSTASLYQKGQDVEKLLRQNVFIKQFVTTNNFGRSLVYSSVGKDDKKHGEYKVSVIKPGRAKSVIVTMPKAFQDSLTNTSGLRTAIDNISGAYTAASDDKGNVTGEMIDVAIRYDDFAKYIAGLMGGSIAEYGSRDGQLAYQNKKYDKSGNEVDTPADVEEVINGKTYVLYSMHRPDSNLMKALSEAGGISNLSDKNKSVVSRYKDGKTPLKRSSKSASPLYTPNNFVSTIKYDTVNPFSADVTDADLTAICSKAKAQTEKDGSPAPAFQDDKAIKDALLAGKPAPMFDKSTGTVQDRYKIMTKGYRDKDINGNQSMGKEYAPAEDYKANPDKYKDWLKDGNNRPYREVPKAHEEVEITSRTPKDFFTGRKLTEADDIQFIKFTGPLTSKNNKPILPRAMRSTVVCSGIDSKAGERAEVTGTFSLSDGMYTHVRTIGITDQVLEQAITQAVKNARGSSMAKSQMYDAGVMAALLAQYA